MVTFGYLIKLQCYCQTFCTYDIRLITRALVFANFLIINISVDLHHFPTGKAA